MKLALLSDIHANLEALTAVLREVEHRQVDEIYSLGDVIGYGCDPSECLRLVDSTCKVRLMGNHEFSVLGHLSTDSYTHVARVSTEWTQHAITDREAAIIADFEMECWLDDILLVHASPYEPEEWHYILTPSEAADAFDHFDGAICFHGHSHIPVIFSEVPGALPRRKSAHDFDPSEESRYIVNVGSVGQPRDNDPRACFAILDTESRHVEYHRVEYDIKQTQAKMTDADLPKMLVNRLAVGR